MNRLVGVGASALLASVALPALLAAQEGPKTPPLHPRRRWHARGSQQQFPGRPARGQQRGNGDGLGGYARVRSRPGHSRLSRLQVGQRRLDGSGRALRRSLQRQPGHQLSGSSLGFLRQGSWIRSSGRSTLRRSGGRTARSSTSEHSEEPAASRLRSTIEVSWSAVRPIRFRIRTTSGWRLGPQPLRRPNGTPLCGRTERSRTWGRWGRGRFPSPSS